MLDKDGSSIICKIALNGIPISKMLCVAQADNILLIGDITPYEKNKYYNKGDGSLMMNSLLKFAKSNGFHYIYGNLSIVDYKHKDRLHAYYNKHDFTIIEFKTPHELYYGMVFKNI